MLHNLSNNKATSTYSFSVCRTGTENRLNGGIMFISLTVGLQMVDCWLSIRAKAENITRSKHYRQIMC